MTLTKDQGTENLATSMEPRVAQCQKKGGSIESEPSYKQLVSSEGGSLVDESQPSK